MARNLTSRDDGDRPETPRLARLLLRWLAPSGFREALLGDLQEQWHGRLAQSGKAPQAWYWRQVSGSVPTLIGFRLRAIGAWRFGLLALSYLIGFVAISAWDISVSRALVGSLAAQDAAPSLIVLRAIYFVLFGLGSVVAALLATPLAFDKRWSLRTNLLLGVAPVFLLINGLLLVSALAAGAFDLMPYLLFRSALMGVMLLLAGIAVHKFRITLDRLI